MSNRVLGVLIHTDSTHATPTYVMDKNCSYHLTTVLPECTNLRLRRKWKLYHTSSAPLILYFTTCGDTYLPAWGGLCGVDVNGKGKLKKTILAFPSSNSYDSRQSPDKGSTHTPVIFPSICHNGWRRISSNLSWVKKS